MNERSEEEERGGGVGGERDNILNVSEGFQP